MAQGSQNESQTPLHFMTDVSETVSVWRPTSVAHDTERPSTAMAIGDDPSLIIILAWMDARPRPLAKFCLGFQKLFPSSTILLMRSSLWHQMWQPGVIPADVLPVIPIIREVVNTDARAATPGNSDKVANTKPRVLNLSFSNGGTSLLSFLYRAYDEDFPPHINVFDSGPGRSKYFLRAAAPITEGFNKPYLFIIAASMIAIPVALTYRAWYFGRKDGMDQHRETLNSAALERGRVYIYSESDGIIDYRYVESHAMEAESRGLHVALERFDGTGHIGHMKVDAERYWRIVSDAWETAFKPRL